MITSIFTSTLPCVGILLGMQCTKIFEDSPNLKRKIILWSGLSYFLSGKVFRYFIHYRKFCLEFNTESFAILFVSLKKYGWQRGRKAKSTDFTTNLIA